MFSRDKWSRRVLLLACAAYWAVLLLVLLGPPLIAGWRVTRPDAGHGAINASLDGAMLNISMSSAHTASWSGSIGLWTLSLLIAGPPIVLWLALRGTRQRDSMAPLRAPRQ